jgi:hypothetical protein
MAFKTLEDECKCRLERILSAIGILQQEEDIKELRAHIRPTPQIGIPTLEIEIKPNQSRGLYGTQWRPVCRALQSDIEMTFFSGDYLRPSLRRKGLFVESRDGIDTRTIHVASASSHEKINAIATLRSIGADVPY